MPETKIEIARQIGNAVPVGLASAMATCRFGSISPDAGQRWRRM